MRSPLNDALNRKWSEASATLEKLERELAAAKEELAKLRQHAEAMAYRIENDEGKSTDIFYKRLCDVAAAYRADFPEDAK